MQITLTKIDLPDDAPDWMPRRISVSPGFTWYSKWNVGKIGRIEVLKKRITEYQLPALAPFRDFPNFPPAALVPRDILTPRDNDVWFATDPSYVPVTEESASLASSYCGVGRLDGASRELTAYFFPELKFVVSIALSPKGSLWLTGIKYLPPSYSARRELVAVLGATKSHNLKCWVLPKREFWNPDTIYVAKDQAVWFTVNNPNAGEKTFSFGRLDPLSGKLLAFKIGTGLGMDFTDITERKGLVWIAGNGGIYRCKADGSEGMRFATTGVLPYKLVRDDKHELIWATSRTGDILVDLPQAATNGTSVTIKTQTFELETFETDVVRIRGTAPMATFDAAVTNVPLSDGVTAGPYEKFPATNPFDVGYIAMKDGPCFGSGTTIVHGAPTY